MSFYLEGITPQELKELFREAVKEEIEAVIKQQKEKSSNYTNELLTREETAKLLSVSLPTLHNWCLQGIIPSYRFNTRIRFKREDIEKLLENPRGIKHNRNK
ncbi:DNA-binding protein [Flavobacterium sediminis]|uniref:DNA-binding protein n=1 Tax=Flavobacterium sediminis TaxID=2201181 RepID=A0A2U8QWQ8_9FLAO|nr:helix-turn-helix domain-containing protein [Flavobacterium sediminis]AWM14642.1 DNA-binding protein [Flavobacterium sediminis]